MGEGRSKVDTPSLVKEKEEKGKMWLVGKIKQP